MSGSHDLARNLIEFKISFAPIVSLPTVSTITSQREPPPSEKMLITNKFSEIFDYLTFLTERLNWLGLFSHGWLAMRVMFSRIGSQMLTVMLSQQRRTTCTPRRSDESSSIGYKPPEINLAQQGKSPWVIRHRSGPGSNRHQMLVRAMLTSALDF